MEAPLSPSLSHSRPLCMDPMKHLSTTDYTRGSTADRYFKVRVVHNSLLAWITRPTRSCILREQWADPTPIHARTGQPAITRSGEIFNGARFAWYTGSILNRSWSWSSNDASGWIISNVIAMIVRCVDELLSFKYIAVNSRTRLVNFKFT